MGAWIAEQGSAIPGPHTASKELKGVKVHTIFAGPFSKLFVNLSVGSSQLQKGLRSWHIEVRSPMVPPTCPEF